MAEINEMLLEDEVLEDTFASFLLMHWDPASHTVTYANAGHCRPVLITPKSVEIAEHSDLILGLEAEASFSDTVLDLPPKAAIIAYTDGLMELPATDGDMLGEEGVVKAVSAAYGSSNPMDALLDAALELSDEETFQDDILTVWLQRLNSSSS
jgi:serine phosphatase RsbU (regulator of sigma subunit)